MYEKVVIMTISNERRPWVPAAERIKVEELRAGSFYRVTACYGFMEMPKVREILHHCRAKGQQFDFSDATFYLGESTIVPAQHKHRMQRWARLLFAWMLTNARPIDATLEIPPDQVVRIGTAVPV